MDESLGCTYGAYLPTYLPGKRAAFMPHYKALPCPETFVGREQIVETALLTVISVHVYI